MPCKHYKDALIETAASGAAPQGELRPHLSECVSCRSAFEQEQSLFAAIESGLYANANAEVPVTLLPHVRARLDQVALPTRSGFTSWYAFAVAAAMVLILLGSRAVWHGSIPEGPSPTVVSSGAPALSRSHAAALSGTHPLATTEGSTPIGRKALRTGAGSLPALRNDNPSAEVLVPKDQERMLASYAEQWQARKRPPLVPVNPDDTSVALLEVAPIQIDQLDVKSLAGEKSQ